MHRAIVFTSGKGGVGKSTLTLSVGRALAEMGRTVALMDTDIGLNNLDVLMNVEQSVVYDLVDVVNNRCRLSQALVADKADSRLVLLPSAHSYNECFADGQSLRAIVARLKASFEFVLIDCPAGVEYGFHRAVAAADEAIVVTSAHLSALKDASKVAALVKSYRLPVSLVLNRVRGDMLVGGDSLTVGEIADAINMNVIGVVPEDDGVNMISSGGDMRRHSEGKKAVGMLARNIISATSELYDVTKKYRGFWGGIKRRLKERL